MKVIIAGSRDIADRKLIFDIVDDFPLKITEVVCGGARGVDKIGEEWAKKNSIPVTPFTPNWDTLGKSAGDERNKRMANYADALIAIWDGKSKGTRHMIDLALSNCKVVVVVKP